MAIGGYNQIETLNEKVIYDNIIEWWRENGVEVFELPKPLARVESPKATTPTIMPAVQSIINPNNALEDAQKLAAACLNLADLKMALEGFENFHLKKTATQMVFSDGVETADIMAIGDAPASEEDAAGKPFIGAAGKFLDNMLASIGISRQENIYLTNLVNWRPPANRALSKEEIAISTPFLKKHIELKKPKLLILLGEAAANAVLQSDIGINKLRKNIQEIDIGYKIPVFCLYHPSHILQRPAYKAQTWADLLAIKAKIKEIGSGLIN